MIISVRVAGVLRLRSVEAGDHAVCMDNGDKGYIVLGISISISIFKISCNETVSNKEKIDLKMMKSLASFLSFSDQSSLHALIVIQASSVSLIISVSVDNGSPRLRGQISPHDSYHQVSDPHVDCRVKASLSVLGEMVVLS
ncbi:hypothetical protein Tco_0455454 [Tanacetum coccineum]